MVTNGLITKCKPFRVWDRCKFLTVWIQHWDDEAERLEHKIECFLYIYCYDLHLIKLNLVYAADNIFELFLVVEWFLYIYCYDLHLIRSSVSCLVTLSHGWLIHVIEWWLEIWIWSVSSKFAVNLILPAIAAEPGSIPSKYSWSMVLSAAIGGIPSHSFPAACFGLLTWN